MSNKIALTIRALAELILVCFLVISGIAFAAPINSEDIRVIDGDTIRVYHKQPNVRLVGYGCAGNAARGMRARTQVRCHGHAATARSDTRGQSGL